MAHDEPTNQPDDADDTPPEVATQSVEEATTHLPYHNTTATLVQDLTIAPLRAYLNGGSNAPHPADAMIRAYLLKEIRGIPHKSELVEYLEENEKTAHRFGFDTDGFPTRIQCSRWWNHYFAPELCAIINHSAKAIREEAYESGIRLMQTPLNPTIRRMPLSGRKNASKMRKPMR